MPEEILSHSSFEHSIEELHGRQILKLAMISHNVPIVAATYSAHGSRLCHENLANLPEPTLKQCLSVLDNKASEPMQGKAN